MNHIFPSYPRQERWRIVESVTPPITYEEAMFSFSARQQCHKINLVPVHFLAIKSVKMCTVNLGSGLYPPSV